MHSKFNTTILEALTENIDIDKYILVNFYCKSQAQSKIIKDFLKPYNAKYFVSESKIL